MFNIVKTDETKRIIFEVDDTQFRINDEFFFFPPKHEDDGGFFNSNVGELFESGKIDSLRIKVYEAKWLEIIFEISFMLNGKELTNAEKFEEANPADGDWNNEIYTEDSGYIFIRYLAGK